MYNLKIALYWIFYVTAFNCMSSSLGATTVIDQRQTGEYNIHLNIKDVTIIALDNLGSIENGVEHGNDDAVYEDYDYNLDELTINPLIGLFGNPSQSNNKPPTKPQTTENVNNIQEIIALQNSNKSDVKPVISIQIESTTEPVKLITPPATVSNLVVIQESTIAPNKGSNILLENKPANNVAPNYSSQHIPVQIIMEPVTIPKRRNNNKQTNLRRHSKRPATVEVVTSEAKKTIYENDREVECLNGQYRDANGKCRARRAEGISRLIKLLLSNKKD